MHCAGRLYVAVHDGIFQAAGFVRMESGPTQAVLPLVGLAADEVVRDRYTYPLKQIVKMRDLPSSHVKK